MNRGADSAKVVLVGDHPQLPAIGAGGAFRGLVDRLPAALLPTEPSTAGPPAAKW